MVVRHAVDSRGSPLSASSRSHPPADGPTAHGADRVPDAGSTAPVPWRLTLVATLLAALARAVLLPDRPLWSDEALGLLHATGRVAAVPGPVAVDLQPPGWTALLGLWAALHPGDAWLRTLPGLAGLATVPILAWSLAPWRRPRATATALGLVVLGGPWVLYAGEVRPYALLLAGASGWLGAVARGRTGPLVAWGALLLGTSWSAGPLVAAGLLTTAGVPGPPGTASATGRRRAVLRAAGTLALLTLALALGALAPQLGATRPLADGPLARWMGWPDGPWALLERTVGVLGHPLTGTAGPRAVAAGLLVLGLGAAATRASRRATDPEPPTADGLAIPAVLAALTAGGLALASLAGLHPFGPTRHVLGLAPAVLTALALALDQAGPRWTRRGGALLAAVLAAMWTLRPPTLPVQEVPTVMAEVAADRTACCTPPTGRPGGTVWVDAPAVPAVAWYGRDDPSLWTPDGRGWGPWVWRRPAVLPQHVADRAATVREPLWVVGTSSPGHDQTTWRRLLTDAGLRVTPGPPRVGAWWLRAERDGP